MSERLILTNIPAGNQTMLAAALSDGDGRLQDFFLYPAASGSMQPGEVYLAAVDKLHPQTDGAFLNAGSGRTVYMPFHGKDTCGDYCMKTRRESGTPLRTGDELIIQIDAAAQKTKRPHASGEINLSGRYLALTSRDPGWHYSRRLTPDERAGIRTVFQQLPAPVYGCIIRTNARDAAEKTLLQEYQSLNEAMNRILSYGKARPVGSCLYRPDAPWLHLLDRMAFQPASSIVTDIPEVYEILDMYLQDFPARPSLSLYEDPALPLCKLHGLSRQLERLTEKRVWLRSGAMIVIEPTEAFVSIDVNTGKYTGKQSREETAARINLEAAEECMRQIRLRQLSGTILIDFINMNLAEHTSHLMEYLRTLAMKDPVKTNVIDMTALGIVELTREKRYQPLAEQLRQR